MASAPAIFLDRDDTLIRNVPYLGDPSLVQLLPGVKEGIALLKETEFLLVIVSNQSGVGRGLITEEEVASVNRRMQELLQPCAIDAIYNCYLSPSHPDAHARRKPSPFLLHLAAGELGIDIASSFIIGDRESDVLAGKNAGCLASLRLASTSCEDNARPDQTCADYIAKDFMDAVQWILESRSTSKRSNPIRQIQPLPDAR